MQKLLRSFFITVLLGFFTVASAQLPPEMMADKYLIEAEQLHTAKDYARVALSADSINIVLDSVNKYLSATEEEGEFYALPLTQGGQIAKSTLWGALAIDSNQGSSWGWAINYSTVQQAEQRALAECGNNCHVVMRFSDQCGAFAADQEPGSTIYGWGKADSRVGAQNRALSECRRRGGTSCRVRVWGCTQQKDSANQVSQERMTSFKMPEMVVIPAGRFKMGCASGDCDSYEKPVHSVRIASFALSKYEVTFEEYDAFTDATGRARANDAGWGRGRRPVTNVSWKDAVAYTQWLSSQIGEHYRFPSEAEWEYTARAGSTTLYSWGNDIGRNRANCRNCGSRWDERQTAPVGSFSANDWGLHDMPGNVWEWGEDCWNDNYGGAPTDGSAWESGDCSERVLRGGSWLNGLTAIRSAKRATHSAANRFYLIGFRVARSF